MKDLYLLQMMRTRSGDTAWKLTGMKETHPGLRLTALEFGKREAGFDVENILEGFEKDTGYTYLTVICRILEDDPYGES